VLCIERITVHCVEGVSGRISISEFDKDISMRARLVRLRHNAWWTYPWLFPILSFHGMEISSTLIAAPFRVNSFDIFDKSFSSFDLSITGIPSTTRMWSKPSSRRTLYLGENFLDDVLLIIGLLARTFLRYPRNRCHRRLHLRWPLCLLIGFLTSHTAHTACGLKLVSQAFGECLT
jgi:hypothetical protein